jgi:hypothetical protein
VLAALATFAAQAAVVYKWIDPDGVVHYSDQPVPGAEKIYTSASATQGTAPARTGDSQAGNPQKPASALGYTQFAITSPTPQQTFFGDEAINAHLALEPALKPGQTVAWQLNGAEFAAQTPTETAVTLPHLDRGTYAITATVTDPATGESRSTDSVTFYVRQPSELSPQHRKP